MCAAARRRTKGLADGRLAVVQGDLHSAHTFASVDLVLAVHVLYFWHEPRTQARQLSDLLVDGGVLALGYQLRRHMPKAAQKYFPREGHRLYDSDDEVAEILATASLDVVGIEVMGDPARPAASWSPGERAHGPSDLNATSALSVGVDIRPRRSLHWHTAG